MQEPADRPSTAASPADVKFVERWANFAKAFSIYPVTNVRVREALEGMRSQLSLLLAGKPDAEEGLRVAFFHDGLLIDDAEVELRDGTNLAWLHQRVRKAALDGVTFARDVEDEAILAFTARLLSLFARAEVDAEFSDLWPEPPPGLQLHDKHFAGRFRRDGEHERPGGGGSGGTGGSAGTGGTDAGSGSGTSNSDETGEIDTSEDQALAALLMEDGEIRESLDSLQDCLEKETREGEASFEVDVLGRLIQLMPPDAMDDRETLFRVTRTALRSLSSRVADQGGVLSLPDDLSLLQRMFETSQGLLGRLGPSNEEVAVRLREHEASDDAHAPDYKGHAGDEKIKDEADLFWQDLAAMPPARAEKLNATNVESVPEQVGVFLHFLTAADHPEGAELVRAGLARRLEGAGKAEAAVLLPYLDTQQEGPDEGSAQRRDQVLEFLREENLARLLRECGHLRKDKIHEQFPHEFGLYLEALDPEVAEDRLELASLAESLGASRIEAAADQLIDVERIASPERMSRIVSVRTPSVFPFVHLLLDRVEPRERRPLVAALRQVRGDELVACLLSIVDEPELLPVKYLQALARDDGATADRWGQRDLIAGVICRYVHSTVNRPEKAERRAYAIKHLEHFMTPEARQLLVGLLRARRSWIFPREPKVVRQAARRALQSAKAR